MENYKNLPELPYKTILKITKIEQSVFGDVYVFADKERYKINDFYNKKFEYVFKEIKNYQMLKCKKFFPKTVYIDKEYKFLDKLCEMIN